MLLFSPVLAAAKFQNHKKYAKVCALRTRVRAPALWLAFVYVEY